MPILIVEHAGLRQTVPLSGKVAIGRDAECHIVINHPIVSRQHAFVEPNGSATTAIVTDNRSRNGILIAGEKLNAPRTLRDGDIFQVGPATIAFHAADPEIEIEAPSVDAAEVAGIVFACVQCSARLWAPRGAGGASTTCPQCRQKVVCPGGDSNGRDVTSVTAKTDVCPVCQWKVTSSERFTACPACGLVYHSDCWTDNKGCAAYGCAQVNILAADHNDALTPDASPERMDVRPDLTTDLIDDEVELRRVEAPILACSVIATLIGLLAYGIPPAVVLVIAACYLVSRRGHPRGMLAAAVVISFVGAIAGALASLYWWMSLSPLKLIGQ